MQFAPLAARQSGPGKVTAYGSWVSDQGRSISGASRCLAPHPTSPVRKERGQGRGYASPSHAGAFPDDGLPQNHGGQVAGWGRRPETPG